MKTAFYLVLIFKTILLVLFSSDYQNRLFIPFVEHFLTNFSSPWPYLYQTSQIDAFPYHPLMLYILSFFYLPFHLLFHHSIILQNFFFKLPTLLSDILIAFLLYRLFPRKSKEILLVYFTSPIIIYASYMHSQLDLIPTAILFLSVYLLITNRTLLSAFVLGLALSTKLHVVVAYPLMLFYIFKNCKSRDIAQFIIIPPLVYCIFTFPYIFDRAYYYMVLSNPKQHLVFTTFFNLGGLKIYLPIFAALVLTLRFTSYKKINNDLFYSFLGILFSVLVLTIVPAPGWYLWALPFLSVFFIKYYEVEDKIIYLYFALSAAYIVYFVFFFIPDYPDLTFLTINLDFKIHNVKIMSVFFTVLESILFVTVYSLYKFGVRSNLVYQKDNVGIIGICGDSGVGKTVLSQDIKALLGERMLWLEGDAGHKWERGDENWKVFNHLNPKANFIYGQAEKVLKLKIGKTVPWSDYDHATGKFNPERQIRTRDFIVISGVHTFYLPIMREIIDLKIYVDTDERLRRHWKIIRDIQQRNYNKEAVLEQIERRIDDAQKYVLPQKNYSDMIINYFVEEDFPVGDISASPLVKLKIVFDSGIDIEPLIKRLSSEKVEISQGYADDLKSQDVIISHPPSRQAIESAARELIVNREEILAKSPYWLGGFRGVVQLFVLLIFSEKMKKKVNS